MLMVVSLLAPLVLTAVIALAGTLGPERAHWVRRAAAMLSPVTVLPAATLSVISPEAELQAPWLLFGTVFTLDPAARALTLIGALLYGAALMAVTWVKLRDAERGAGALSAFLMVCFAGNIGTYWAADAVSFYLSFAVMSFSAAGLVIHYRHQAARRATRIYLVMSVISETAILAGLILTAGAGGYLVADAPAAVASSDHAGLIVALLLIGFGVKAGTVPLHVWLPLAHPAAPPAASAVLSGAMVKAGLVGWIRFLPLGEEPASVVAGQILLTLALIGAFAAVVVGVLQKDPKVVLAYSTISQMGFMTCLVAVALLVPEVASAATAAALLYAVHHGLAKGALFLGVPVVKHYGRGGTGVLVALGMTGAALAVAGAPLTSGAYGKYVSKEAVEGISVLGVGLDQLLPLVATGSTLLLMRFAWVLSGAGRAPARPPDGELLSWLAVCAAGVTVPWMVGLWWLPGAGEFGWTASALWDASWPILLGVAVGFAVWWAALQNLLPIWLTPDGETVEPGDIVVAEESLVVRGWQGASAGLEAAHAASTAVRSRGAGAGHGVAEWSRRSAARAELTLSSWEGSGLVILVLTAAAAVIVVWAGGMW
jgi:formate hydrogenlyase subunit 3/multisubunit Na+/H+ antiporter MnhD subunit